MLKLDVKILYRMQTRRKNGKVFKKICKIVEKKETEEFIETLDKKDEFIEEIIEEMKKLDGDSLFKIGEILNELVLFSRLPISSSQVNRFKKVMECYDIARKL